MSHSDKLRLFVWFTITMWVMACRYAVIDLLGEGATALVAVTLGLIGILLAAAAAWHSREP